MAKKLRKQITTASKRTDCPFCGSAYEYGQFPTCAHWYTELYQSWLKKPTYKFVFVK